MRFVIHGAGGIGASLQTLMRDAGARGDKPGSMKPADLIAELGRTP